MFRDSRARWGLAGAAPVPSRHGDDICTGKPRGARCRSASSFVSLLTQVARSRADAAAKMLKDIVDNVEHEERYLLRYRPDLSYIPAR